MKTSVMLLCQLESYGITREIWTYFTFRDVTKLLTTSKDIRELSLRMNTMISFGIDVYGLSDGTPTIQIFFNIMRTFPLISRLVFGHCKKMDIYVQVFFNASPRLCESLLELSVYVTYKNALRGVSNLRNLTALDLQDSIVDYFTIAEVSRLSKLVALKIGFGFDPDDDDDSCIEDIDGYTSGDMLDKLSFLTNLRYLHFSIMDKITDDVQLLNFLSKMTALTFVKIVCGVRYLGLYLFSPDLSALSYIECLDIGGFIDDEGISRLSSLRYLTDLNISNNIQLTNMTLVHLSRSTFELNALHIVDCFGITDYSYSFLHKLIKFSTGGTSLLVRSSLFRYLPLFTRLRYLQLKDCYHIFDETLLHVISLQNLTYLDFTSKNGHLYLTNNCFLRLFASVNLEYLKISCDNYEMLQIVLNYMLNSCTMKRLIIEISYLYRDTFVDYALSRKMRDRISELTEFNFSVSNVRYTSSYEFEHNGLQYMSHIFTKRHYTTDLPVLTAIKMRFFQY